MGRRHKPSGNPYSEAKQPKKYQEWYYENVTRKRLNIKGRHGRPKK